MIFIEPTVVFVRRTQPLNPPPLPVALSAGEIMGNAMSNQSPQTIDEDELRELIIEILSFEGGYPTKIVDVVNRIGTWTPALCRREREKVKIMAFRRIGQMVRTGTLRRVARNFVMIAPQKEEAHTEARLLDPAEMPEPRL
jgi:hypothetical protein